MKNSRTIVLFFLTPLLFFGCGKKNEEETSVQKEPYCLSSEFKTQTDLTTVTMEPVTDGIHLTGAVESNPDRVVRFTSLVEGIISKTYFSLGDEVKKGQVLADLQSSELSGLQSDLRNIRSETQVAQKHLESVESMYNDGIASEKDLLEAQTQLEIQKSEERKVISNLELYSGSEESGVFQLRAPNSGVITSKSIAEGARVTSDGEPLFTISDLSDVWVMVNIYATNVQHIDTGMKVTLESLSYPDVMFEGEISGISQVLDEDAKVLKARIVLENPDFKLKPGMLVDVIALKDRNMTAVSIPTKAMVFDDNQNYVVVYKDDCDLEIRKVDILSANNGFTFLKSGVEENEQIIVKNPLLVYEQLNN